MFKGHTEEEEAAGWKFLKFMTDTEYALKWANGTGYLPTRQSCMESDTFKKMIEEDPNLQIIVDQVQYSTYKTPFIPQYQEAKEIFSYNWKAMVFTEEPISLNSRMGMGWHLAVRFPPSSSLRIDLMW